MGVDDLQTFKDVSDEDKRILLELMGYRTDGSKVLQANGSVYEDPYSGGPVTLSNMAVLPGSWIVIDYNPVSINGYITEHGA